MNNQYLINLLTLILLLVGSVAVQDSFAGENRKEEKVETQGVLYKTIDANGKVSYSDKPSANAKKIPMSEGQSINLKPPEVKFYSSNGNENAGSQNSQPLQSGYSSISIIQPEDDGVLRNNGGVAVFEVMIKPELKKTDYLVFFIDGNQADASVSGNNITVSNVEYGPHTAHFSVFDNKDKEVIKSESIRFNLLHTVRRKVSTTEQNNSLVNRNDSNALVASKLKIQIPEHPKPIEYKHLRKREN